MSLRKQEQQRLRRARQATSQPIIYEEEDSSNVGLPTEPTSVPAPAPQLDVSGRRQHSARQSQQSHTTARIFHRRGQVQICLSGVFPRPRLSADSRIRGRQKTTPAPKRLTTTNNGKQHRRPVQRSGYQRTI